MKHFFKLYPGDYMRDCWHLSTEEHGAYFLLMLWYYSNGPIPNDDDTIRRIMQVDSSAFARTWGTLKQKFQLSGDKWRHKRIEAEISEREEQYRKQSEAAARTNAKRRKTPTLTATHSDTLSAPLTGTQPEPEPEPEPKPQPEPNYVGSVASKEAPRPASKRNLCDADWLAGLKDDPAYHDLDVDEEHAKMARWCLENGKRPTRRRLVNWLNRADKPMKVAQNESSRVSGAQLIVWQKEMDRATARITQIRASYDSHREMDKADRDEIRKLRLHVDELKARLGVQV